MLITLRKCICHFCITLLKMNINKFEKNVFKYKCITLYNYCMYNNYYCTWGLK